MVIDGTIPYNAEYGLWENNSQTYVFTGTVATSNNDKPTNRQIDSKSSLGSRTFSNGPTSTPRLKLVLNVLAPVPTKRLGTLPRFVESHGHVSP